MSEDYTPAAEPPKHRACDECRFRKIACSKEPGGCVRCEKEGIPCHYSPQKPMGRPRKRRLVDDGDEGQPLPVAVDSDGTEYAAAVMATSTTAGLTAAPTTTTTTPPPTTTTTTMNEMAAARSGFDADFAFLAMPSDDDFESVVCQMGTAEAGSKPPLPLPFASFPSDWNAVGTSTGTSNIDMNMNMSFIDLLPDFSPDSPDIFGQGDPAALAYTSPSTMGQSPFDGSSFCGSPMNASELGALTFDGGSTGMNNSNGLSRHDHHHVDTPPQTACNSPHHMSPLDASPPAGCQNRSSSCHQARSSCQQNRCHNNHSQSRRHHEQPSTTLQQATLSDPGIPCTCLSSLYFALSSLAQLPTHIPSAIRTARHASRMAYQVINCPACYDVTIVDPARQPPIQCFQNLMCLGSLVPAACAAYASILRAVDAEADRAAVEQRRLWFGLAEFGGPWAAGLPAQGECLRRCSDRFLPPDLWRAAVRRILRLDVHGSEGEGQGEGQGQVHSSTELDQQQPLKGVITLLDEKNRRRHAQIDHLISTGRMPENSPYLLFPGTSNHKVPVVRPEARNCSHVLETARLALSNLSIA